MCCKYNQNVKDIVNISCFFDIVGTVHGIKNQNDFNELIPPLFRAIYAVSFTVADANMQIKYAQIMLWVDGEIKAYILMKQWHILPPGTRFTNRI